MFPEKPQSAWKLFPSVATQHRPPPAYRERPRPGAETTVCLLFSENQAALSQTSSPPPSSDEATTHRSSRRPATQHNRPKLPTDHLQRKQRSLSPICQKTGTLIVLNGLCFSIGITQYSTMVLFFTSFLLPPTTKPCALLYILYSHPNQCRLPIRRAPKESGLVVSVSTA